MGERQDEKFDDCGGVMFIFILVVQEEGQQSRTAGNGVLCLGLLYSMEPFERAGHISSPMCHMVEWSTNARVSCAWLRVPTWSPSQKVAGAHCSVSLSPAEKGPRNAT